MRPKRFNLDIDTLAWGAEALKFRKRLQRADAVIAAGQYILQATPTDKAGEYNPINQPQYLAMQKALAALAGPE